MRLFRPALAIAALALSIHVIATLGQWAWLQWQTRAVQRELAAVAQTAAPESAAAMPPLQAIGRRDAELRHRAGLPARDDFLPLLARAAPALATLPTGSVRSLRYADGHVVLELQKSDAAQIAHVQRELQGRGLTAIAAADGGRGAAASGHRLMATAVELDTRDRLTHWWRLRTHAERAAVVAGAALAIAALAWLLVWLPIQADIARLTRELAVQRAALAQARVQADAIGGLERRTPPPVREPRAALDLALAQSGIKASAIDRTGDDLRVTIDGISFDALAILLESLQRDAALRVVDLTAAARVESGMVRAEFTLRR